MKKTLLITGFLTLFACGAQAATVIVANGDFSFSFSQTDGNANTTNAEGNWLGGFRAGHGWTYQGSLDLKNNMVFDQRLFTATTVAPSGTVDLANGTFNLPTDFSLLKNTSFGDSFSAGPKTVNFTLTDSHTWLGIFFAIDNFDAGGPKNLFTIDNVAVVPEPSTFVLGLLGLATLGFRRRR